MIDATLTFSLDEANEPTSVTIEGPEFMTTTMFREFAQETLDSHFGSVDHNFRVHVSPLSREKLPDDDVSVTFDIRKRD
jgi:hypothetical protein